jgi:hypothetical protein
LVSYHACQNHPAHSSTAAQVPCSLESSVRLFSTRVSITHHLLSSNQGQKLFSYLSTWPWWETETPKYCFNNPEIKNVRPSKSRNVKYSQVNDIYQPSVPYLTKLWSVLI